MVGTLQLLIQLIIYMALTKLLFIRHASVDYTCIPEKDLLINLNSFGKTQSTKLSKNLFNKFKLPIAAIYSSDLPRAIETIKPYSDIINKEIIIEPKLREHNYNGNPKIFHKLIKSNSSFHYLDGETIQESKTRFLKAINTILINNIGQCSIISTHGTVFTEFMKFYFNKTDEFYYELSNPDIYYILFNKYEAIYYKRLKSLLPSI